MANPREQSIRSTHAISLARAIKRQRYDERAIIQVLRVTPDKAKAILNGQLDGFSNEEIRKFVDVLS